MYCLRGYVSCRGASTFYELLMNLFMISSSYGIPDLNYFKLLRIKVFSVFMNLSMASYYPLLVPYYYYH